jgi:CRP/FNR family transcriptional regulator, anaerobic regulatory protein
MPANARTKGAPMSRRARTKKKGCGPSSIEPRLGFPACERCDVRRFTFCSALNVDEQMAVSAIAVTMGFAPRQTIIWVGDPSEFVFNLTAGAALVYKLLVDGRRQVTGFLMPGDFFGLAPRGVYVYSVETITPVTLCRYPRAALDGLCRKYPRLEERMFRGVMDELALAQDQILMLGRQGAQERVAAFLINLSERIAQHGGDGDSIELPMTRADIADYLGSTTETVSRTVTAMARDGLIAMQRPDRIDLSDREALVEISQWPSHLAARCR